MVKNYWKSQNVLNVNRLAVSDMSLLLFKLFVFISIVITALCKTLFASLFSTSLMLRKKNFHNLYLVAREKFCCSFGLFEDIITYSLAIFCHVSHKTSKKLTQLFNFDSTYSTPVCSGSQ